MIGNPPEGGSHVRFDDDAHTPYVGSGFSRTLLRIRFNPHSSIYNRQFS
jgi:hypothetical protein